MLAILSKLLLIFVCVFTPVSCNNKFDSPHDSVDEIFEAPNMKIEHLKNLFELGYINQDLIIGGRIMSSDSAQNFYKRCFVQDDTGGIQIMINNYDIYSLYPPGDSVWVNLNGLAVGEKDGVKCIGYPTNSDYIEPISSVVLLRKIIHSVGEPRKRPARLIRFDELTPDDIGSLVTVGANFPEIDSTAQAQFYEGVRVLKDENGDLAKLKSTQYCSFAESEVPRGWVYIRAVVIGVQDSGAYELMISDTDDVQPIL